MKRIVTLALLCAALGIPAKAGDGLEELRTAMAQVKDLSTAMREGRTKGNLGAIRSALSIYYGDHEGRYPMSLDELTNGNYLKFIPQADTARPEHAATNSVLVLTKVVDEADLYRQLQDTGGWAYVADPDSPAWGILVVDCTHADSKGRLWYLY
jgi:hypothetical protein